MTTIINPFRAPGNNRNRDPVAGSADAVFAKDIDNGRILYSRNADLRLFSHSVTKNMTALLIVERKGGVLDTTLTITAADVSGLSGISVMGLQANDVITWRHLLYGIMLASGSDACQAAARIIGDELYAEAGNTGTQGVTRFIERMNSRAAELGMTLTTFINTFGRQETGHLSTARDLSRLSEVAFTNTTLQTISGTANFTAVITGVNARNIALVNSSPLIGVGISGILASKTGTWTDGGGNTTANLATLWQSPLGNRVSFVVLHSKSVNQRVTENLRHLGHLPIDFPYLDPGNTLGGTDPSFSNVQLLIGCDSSINDLSPANRTVTNTGCVRTNSVRLMGSHCFLNNGNFVSVADDANLSFANVDFCVELYIRATTAPSAFTPLFAKYDNEANQREWMIVWDNSVNRFRFFFSYNGTTANNFNGDVVTPSVVFNGAVHHIAVTRSGSTLRMFVNGGLQATTFNIGTNSLFNGTAPVVLGARSVNLTPSSGGGYFSGHIDEARVTRGAARYTAAFTPLRRPFPRS